MANFQSQLTTACPEFVEENHAVGVIEGNVVFNQKEREKWF